MTTSLFKSKISTNIGTTPTVIYTNAAALSATVIGLSVANIAGVAARVDATLTKGGITAFLIKQAPVPSGSALVIIGGEQKLVAEANDFITITSSVASSLDSVISVLELY